MSPYIRLWLSLPTQVSFPSGFLIYYRLVFSPRFLVKPLGARRRVGCNVRATTRVRSLTTSWSCSFDKISVIATCSVTGLGSHTTNYIPIITPVPPTLNFERLPNIFSPFWTPDALHVDACAHSLTFLISLNPCYRSRIPCCLLSPSFCWLPPLSIPLHNDLFGV